MSKRKSKTKSKQAAKARGAKQASSPPSRAMSPLDWLLLALIVAGMLITAYLTIGKWTGTAPLYCSDDSPCDLVQSSRWSTFLGMPMALWGFLTYAVLAYLAVRLRNRPNTWKAAFFVAGIGVAISAYLTTVSVTEIEAMCPYCVASFAIITAVFGLLCLRRPEQLQGFQWRKSLPAMVITAAFVVTGLHLHFLGLFDPAAGPEKPYLKALAMHLEKSGARFYGAYWCPRCQEQKEMFEASADRLPYVECTPSGRGGPVNTACLIRDIRNYPTWIIGDRRITGALTPTTLAGQSRFRWDGPPPDSP
jgi:uncharacterized membrane protein